jgi:hypothetical protein
LAELKERTGYCHLKAEGLDRTMWRARFGRGFGPVVRQTDKWMMNCYFAVALQLKMGHGLFILEVFISHSDTPHLVGLLWTSDRLVAETSTWQHTTLTSDRHNVLCRIRTRNPRGRAAAGLRSAIGNMDIGNFYLRWSQVGKRVEFGLNCSLTL